MDKQELDIRRATESTDLDPVTSRLRARMRVEWTLGPHGPFSEYYATDGFDPIKARTDIQQKAAKLAQLFAK